MSATLTEVLPEDLMEHRAIQAWRQLGAESRQPETIQVLKRHAKTAVYRIGGLGPAGSTLVAKRCYTRTGEVERVIYEHLLPGLGLPAVRCYGYVREPAGQYSWLFLEDAVGIEYSSVCDAHRALAGKWLAALYRAAVDTGRLPGLPERDCGYYRNELDLLKAQIRTLQANPVVPVEDLSLLRTLDSQCEIVSTHWEELEDRCSGFPPALVHGDFVVKNVRVRSTPPGAALLVFDWEVAGWGVPATDLAQSVGGTVSPDLAIYRETMTNYGFPLEARLVERVAECGRFFRLIDCMLWACKWGRDDSYIYLSKPLTTLRCYATRLREFLPAMGWSSDLCKRD